MNIKAALLVPVLALVVANEVDARGFRRRICRQASTSCCVKAGSGNRGSIPKGFDVIHSYHIINGYRYKFAYSIGSNLTASDRRIDQWASEFDIEDNGSRFNLRFNNGIWYYSLLPKRNPEGSFDFAIFACTNVDTGATNWVIVHTVDERRGVPGNSISADGPSATQRPQSWRMYARERASGWQRIPNDDDFALKFYLPIPQGNGTTPRAYQIKVTNPENHGGWDAGDFQYKIDVVVAGDRS